MAFELEQTQLICHKCKKVIIEDLKEYKEKYPNEVYIMCPHCGEQGMIT